MVRCGPKPVYQQMTLSPWLGAVGIIIHWHIRSPLLKIFISVAPPPQTIRDLNVLPGSLVSSAECAKDEFHFSDES